MRVKPARLQSRLRNADEIGNFSGCVTQFLCPEEKTAVLLEASVPCGNGKSSTTGTLPVCAVYFQPGAFRVWDIVLEFLQSCDLATVDIPLASSFSNC